MFHLQVHSCKSSVKGVSEPFLPTKKKVARGNSPNSKGEVSPRGRESESRRGWVLVCDCVQRSGIESWALTNHLGIPKNVAKINYPDVCILKCSGCSGVL